MYFSCGPVYFCQGPVYFPVVFLWSCLLLVYFSCGPVYFCQGPVYFPVRSGLLFLWSCLLLSVVLFTFGLVLFSFSVVLFSFILVLFAFCVVLFTCSGGPVLHGKVTGKLAAQPLIFGERVFSSLLVFLKKV